ncbi:MAG: hypothetical protein H6Q90_4876 [Deltaproteobacteria bacterium]|nr:hypothetical protein [Deltaproteobacteria bacterium]
MECPDAELLAAAAAPPGPDGELAQHLASCAACAFVVQALGSSGEDVAAAAAPRTEDAPAGDPEPGDTIGRYVILGRLGSGGMGVVSSAYDPVLDRTIALKAMRADRASPSLARRLEREAQALAKLTHPNLVRVFDAGLDRGRLYLTMELVDGQTLRAWLASARRPTAEIVAVFREVALGLAAVHAAGFVHRDVKPDNILLDRAGTARLADFGLVSTIATIDPPSHAALPRSADAMTDPFTAVGTPAYMSPEQRRGGELDARSDQWSWATSLRDALDDRAIPAALRGVIARAGDPDPGRRYPSMAVVAATLAPARRIARWPFAIAGGVVIASLVAVVGLTAEGDDAVDPCAGEGAEAAAEWTIQAPAIRNAFAMSGHPAWQARFDATAAASTAALSGVADATVGLCRTTGPSRRSIAREQACLDDQRAGARALFVELARADRAMVDQAPLAATRLPRGSACLLPNVLDVTAAPRMISAPLASELARLKARAAVRPPTAVIDEAAALAIRTRALGAAQLDGETRLLLGELQSKLRKDADAQVTLDEAALSAARAHDDRVAALARLLQAGQAALLTSAPQRATALGEVALAAVERAGSPAELRGQLENILGAIAFSRGEFADAERRYRASVVARTEAFGAGDARVAAAHQNLGIALHRLGRTEDARAANEQAVAIMERALGADHPDLATPLSGLGTIAADQHRYDDALRLFERTRTLRIAAFGPDHPDVAISENNLGKLATLRDDPRAAIAHFTRSLEINTAYLGADKIELALPLSGLGAAHADLAEWTLARPLLERALALTEAKRGPDHPALISMLITLANVRLHTGDPGARRALLERALAIARHKLPPTHAQTQTLIELLGSKGPR